MLNGVNIEVASNVCWLQRVLLVAQFLLCSGSTVWNSFNSVWNSANTWRDFTLLRPQNHLLLLMDILVNKLRISNYGIPISTLTRNFMIRFSHLDLFREDCFVTLISLRPCILMHFCLFFYFNPFDCNFVVKETGLSGERIVYLSVVPLRYECCRWRMSFLLSFIGIVLNSCMWCACYEYIGRVDYTA